jgi:hypothetical protein
MDRPTLRLATLAMSFTLGFACATASPSLAATGSWSPRSSGPAPVWTRAGLVRIRTEIAPARPVKHHPGSRKAIANHAFWSAGHLLSDQRPDRRSPTSDGAHLSRASIARLRPSALPDRRARTAVLSALAGIFYDAHAPPSLS